MDLGARRVCDARSIVTPDDRALLARLAESLEPREEILEAYLFGSTATGSTQAHRDLDVAVYLADPRPPASPFGYTADLAALLMPALGTPRVDVVVLNPPEIGDEVRLAVHSSALHRLALEIHKAGNKDGNRLENETVLSDQPILHPLTHPPMSH